MLVLWRRDGLSNLGYHVRGDTADHELQSIFKGVRGSELWEVCDEGGWKLDVQGMGRNCKVLDGEGEAEERGEKA